MVGETTGLKVVVGLNALGGILAVLGGLVFLLGGGAAISLVGGSTVGGSTVEGVLAGLLGVMGVIILVAGAVSLALAYFLWKKSKIAYWITLVFGALNVLSLLTGNLMGALGLVTVYFLWFDKPTKNLFP